MENSLQLPPKKASLFDSPNASSLGTYVGMNACAGLSAFKSALVGGRPVRHLLGCGFMSPPSVGLACQIPLSGFPKSLYTS